MLVLAKMLAVVIVLGLCGREGVGCEGSLKMYVVLVYKPGTYEGHPTCPLLGDLLAGDDGKEIEDERMELQLPSIVLSSLILQCRQT